MKFKYLFGIGILVLFSGCTQNLGQFTVASTNNVRNLNYSIQDKTMTNTEGEACARNIIGIPINQQDALLQRAMDNAIKNGRNKGIDGDVLVNVRISYDTTSTIIYNDVCYKVSGDLIKLK